MSVQNDSPEVRRIELPGGEWLGSHVKQVRQWLGFSQLQMAAELSLTGNSAISYYEIRRPDEALRGLMVVRLRELAVQAGAEIVKVRALKSKKTSYQAAGGTAGAATVEDEVNKSVRENNDPLRVKVENELSRYSSDPHSDIKYLFIVNLDDGGIEYRSIEMSQNSDLEQGLSRKYAEDDGFLNFMKHERNLYNITATVDGFTFALKFKWRMNWLLIGRVLPRGSSFHFMAVKKRMDNILTDLKTILGE